MNPAEARRALEIDALSDVILDAFPVSGAIGRAALALAFVKRAHAEHLSLEQVQRAIASTWAAVEATPEGGAS